MDWLRRSIGRFLAVLLIAGCDNAMPSTDGGPPGEDGGGSTEVCQRHQDCGDQSLFCQTWRCRPGEPGADARGCIDEGSPCSSGQTCDEAMDRCAAPVWCTEGRAGCAAAGDCDGDGAPAIECGGNDCDDGDARRYPGNIEVCDPAAVDEDCNPETFGELDEDGDGHVSASCCNGARCGDDCDDSDINVNPAAREVCNGIDDDCTGIVDDPEGPAALCPGGTCSDGVCRMDGWLLSIGGPALDTLSSVAVDPMGNVYVAGTTGSAVDLGPGPTEDRGGIVVAYDASGVYRWHYEIPYRSEPVDIAVSDGTVYVSGVFFGTVDFGDGSRTAAGTLDGFVLWLSAADGSYRFDRQFPERAHLAAVPDGVIVATNTTATAGADLGNGVVPGPFMAVVKYDSAGSWQWQRVLGPLGVSHVAAAPDGSVAVVGSWSAGRNGATVDFGGDERTLGPFETRLYVLRLDAGGAYEWVYLTGSTYSVPRAIAVTASGAVYVAGTFTNTVSFGGEEHTADSQDGFLFALTREGAFDWDRSFGGTTDSWGGAFDSVAALSYSETSGRLLLAGSFEGTIDLGRAPRTNTSGEPDGFVAQYSGRTLVAEDYFQSDGGGVTVTGVAAGPVGTYAVVGSFEAPLVLGGARIDTRGDRDGFLYRPGI